MRLMLFSPDLTNIISTMMNKLLYVTLSIVLLISASACTTPLVIVGTAAGVGTAVAVTDRRAASKLVEDQSVETQITDFIYGHEEIGKKIHVQVTSFNGTVLLTGEVPDEASKNIILEKANKLRYVDKVIDAMEIKAPISFMDRNNDTWLTAKAKSSLMINKSIITNAKVVSSDKKIYLFGIVNNEEAQKIVDITSKIEGAKEIIPLFNAKAEPLSNNLTAASFKADEKKQVREKELEEKLEAEEEFEVKQYVLPSSVQLTTDEQ